MTYSEIKIGKVRSREMKLAQVSQTNSTEASEGAERMKSVYESEQCLPPDSQLRVQKAKKRRGNANLFPASCRNNRICRLRGGQKSDSDLGVRLGERKGISGILEKNE